MLSRKICSRKFIALLEPCGMKDVEETDAAVSCKTSVKAASDYTAS
jgi:hypothetical protein